MSQTQENTLGRTLDRVNRETTILTKNDSLDHRLSSTSERSLSEKEFLELIALADSLRLYDDRKIDRTILDNIKENYSVAVAYEVAQSLGITSDYVEKAMNLLHPSLETQIADLRKHNAKATVRAISEQYQFDLIKTLRINCPTDQFDESSDKDNINGYIWVRFTKTIKKEEKSRRFLFLKQRKDLACFRFSRDYNRGEKEYFNLSIYLQHPLFLRACGEKLNELNDYFKEQINSYEIKQDYIVSDNW